MPVGGCERVGDVATEARSNSCSCGFTWSQRSLAPAPVRSSVRGTKSSSSRHRALFLLRNRRPQPSFAFFVGLSRHTTHLLRRKSASLVHAMVGRLCPLRCSNHQSRTPQLSSAAQSLVPASSGVISSSPSCCSSSPSGSSWRISPMQESLEYFKNDLTFWLQTSICAIQTLEYANGQILVGNRGKDKIVDSVSAQTHSLNGILFGRFLVGLGTDVNTVLVPIYISESLPCTCEKCHHCSIPQEEELKGKDCLEWWIKLLSAHGIDNYARVMYVMREIVEAIVTLLLSDERGSIIPLSFLLGMLKIRITIDMEISYMHELERRIGYSRFLERVDEEDEDNGYDTDCNGPVPGP
ncbi:hypothetical protein Bca52824_061879 [Brassica carinata]|uniref:NPH3 domain-containing protein n=1 Tax=Brassica carinata TaxID=52824 RepID=A0A8X7QH08_BRACI|nr:hypothetical protein Bca52824_061879 [Brassica carinata]